MERSESAEPVGDSWDALAEVIRQRPSALVVDVERGDIDATFGRILQVLDGR